MQHFLFERKTGENHYARQLINGLAASFKKLYKTICENRYTQKEKFLFGRFYNLKFQQ